MTLLECPYQVTTQTPQIPQAVICSESTIYF